MWHKFSRVLMRHNVKVAHNDADNNVESYILEHAIAYFCNNVSSTIVQLDILTCECKRV